MNREEKIESPFLSLPEACEYLKLKPATLYKYTSNKILNYYKPNNRKIYFKKEDLDKFVMNEDSLIKSNFQIRSDIASDLASE